MRHGSLFSGIGGFDLAAEWMGWENVFHCELNPFGQKVLKYYWPNATSYGDITKTDFTIHRGNIDIVTGGFPCQKFSLAGKGQMDLSEWYQMLRAIREIQPRWVVGENVYGFVSRKRGVSFNQVQTDLEAEGYEVQPYLLPACGAGAPHKRERIWIVAYMPSAGNGGLSIQQWNKREESINTSGSNQQRLNPNTPGTRQKDCKEDRQPVPFGSNIPKQQFTRSTWERFPSESPVYTGNDGLSFGLDLETISESSWRTKSIEAGGNAIVPQVAYEIFKAIEQVENSIQ